jgi:hypothetical protein
MPLPDADKKSPRVYTLSQNTDLENLAFATLQSIGEPINIEELNEDELRRLVLVNLARLTVKGEWSGLLEAGGGDAFDVGPNPTVMHTDYRKTNTNMRTGGGSVYKSGGAVEYFFGPVGYPWIAPHSGTIADVTIKCTSASAGRSVIVAFYSSSDSTGLPDEKIASATCSVASVAEVTQTSFTGTPTVERGTLYWVFQASDDISGGGGGQVGSRDDTATVNCPTNLPGCGMLAATYFGDGLFPNAIALNGETSLPSTVTASDCQGIRRDLIDVIIGW